MNDFIISTAVSVIMGAIVFFPATRILRIPATFGRILTLAFAPILMVLPASFIAGFVLSSHLMIALCIILVLEWYCAALILQVQAKSQNIDLPNRPAFLVGAVYIVISFFAASWVSGQILHALGIE